MEKVQRYQKEPAVVNQRLGGDVASRNPAIKKELSPISSIAPSRVSNDTPMNRGPNKSPIFQTINNEEEDQHHQKNKEAAEEDQSEDLGYEPKGSKPIPSDAIMGIIQA